MKIGILTSASSPFWTGYAFQFMRMGHEVELYALDGNAPRVNAVPVYQVGPEGFDPANDSSRWPYLKCIIPLRRVLHKNRPDILMAMYLSSGGLIGSLSGHRGLVVSALGSDVNTHIDGRVWTLVLRWVCRRAKLVHAVSDDLSEKIVRHFEAPADKMLVAPIGVDTKLLPFVESSSRPGCGRIINTRAHKPLYDQATFVRAIKRLKDRNIQFHAIFASNRDVELTKELVNQSDIQDKVTFLGGYRDDQLPALLADADVYVSSSITDGTSQSLLEAMCTGLFPVVSDIEANRPWVRHNKNGLLFPVGDDRVLADQLERAIMAPELRAAVAGTNRQIVIDNGDVTSQAKRLLEAFERLLHKESGRV